MNDPHPADRLRDLLDRLADDTISAEQHRELQTLLIDHPDAQDIYFEFMDLHIGLQTLTSARPSYAEPEKTKTGPVSSDGSNTWHRYESAGRERTGIHGWRMIPLAATVMTAVSLIALLLFFLHQPDFVPQDSDIASPGSPPHGGEEPADTVTEEDGVILIQAAGARLFGEFLPPAGGTMKFGHEYALISGTIELRFPDGADVILDAPAVMTIVGRERLQLIAGSCSVHAPPGAEGFQIHTPQTEITDLGTRFSVSVSEVGETDIQVLEGLAEIRAHGPDSAHPIRLAARQARRFTGDAAADPQKLEFDADRFRRILPDRIVRYEVRTTDGGPAAELRSVTVQRGGRIQTIPVRDLTGITVKHFRAGKNHANVAVPVGGSGDRLAVLESDALLHTGLLNPGGSVDALRTAPVWRDSDPADRTPGLAVEFLQPVVNRPGPDVVFFELQNAVNPADGDPFHVSPLEFREGRRSLTVRKYDITMDSPEAVPLPEFDLLFFSESTTSVEGLKTGAVDRRIQKLTYHALAVGIDLSDLGFADGETAQGLFFQDALDDEHIVDPVFIAGLPAD